jgi:hypothetical protein
MADQGMLWQTLALPFTGGLQQKADDRARRAPYLDIARDIAFDELGGIQTRLPYLAMNNSIHGGGNLANCRRIAVVNDELLVFTSTAVYSWNAQLSKWALRDTHLAVTVDEVPKFASNGDQIDGDRVELSGTLIETWTEDGDVWLASMDKATGAVLTTPGSIATGTRPRLVALTTRVLLFYVTGAGLVVLSLDPTAPLTNLPVPTTVVSFVTFNAYYDVTKVDGQNLAIGACRLNPTTGYTIFKVTATPTVTTSGKARTCDGPIAVASTPGGGLQTQIIRANSAAIQGDFITTSTLADLTTSQALGATATPVNQIAACYRSVQTSGAFRCYAFWSAAESASGAFRSLTNYVDTAGTIGTLADFVRNVGVASRAFDYNGSVYVWMVFAEASFSFGATGPQLQNTYLLYRDDAAPVSKAVPAAAGGYAPSTGRLPGVALIAGTTTYAWCGAFRRQIPLGKGAGYAARAPKDITFTFDTNVARRTARLGRTLYISGGELLQYDGVRVVEVGFNVFPYALNPAGVSSGGSMADGEYPYKVTWRYQNAQLEQERSTTASIETVTVSGGGGSGSVSATGLVPLTTTRKTANPPAVEIWRAVVAAPPEAPFYLVTSKDPASVSNPNRYLKNDRTLLTLPTFVDALSDDDVTEHEANPENGAFLESLAPPGATIVVATDTRLFLAGVTGDPDRVWYSRLRQNGEIASFHDGLTIDVPRPGGAITALWFDATGVLFIARQTAVYAFAGQGLDNLAQGQNFVLSRIISADVGAVSQETVALTPRGVIFKSLKGWQLLLGNGDVDYIGAGVTDFDSEDVLSIDVVEKQCHEVRILTASRMIVWHYLVDQWSERTINDGLHSCLWAGQHVYLTATGPAIEQTTHTSLTYGMDVERAWIKPASLAADVQNNVGPGGQVASRIRKLQPLGEVRSACLVRVRIAYNYKPGYVDDVVHDLSALAAGSPLEFKIGPKRPQCQALKVRITAVVAGGSATLATADLLPEVITLGSGSGVWTALLRAVTPGELGNALGLDVAFEDSGADPFSVDVRDHFRWSSDISSWEPAINTIGVLVRCRGSSKPTVAQLETAIAAGTALATVFSHDPNPSNVVDADEMLGAASVGTFGGGEFDAPDGEAIKLTALGLEVGIEPGLFRRIASGAST